MSIADARRAIKAMRDGRRGFDADRPQGVVIERERFGSDIRCTATVFLTGAECPLACAMCDLWRYTNPGPTPRGSIPRQLQYASAQCVSADWIKLYNASNFFDPAAVPPADYPAIAACSERYERVVVENHPRFDNRHLREFLQVCPTKLEIAVGLESTDETVLRLLDKRFSAGEAETCIRRWIDLGCDVRAFILIGPPGAPAGGAWIEHTLQSAADAFAWGVRHVSLIPTRADWGPLREWVASGSYETPTAADIERVAGESHQLASPRQSIAVDLWDWKQVRGCCEECREPRRRRLDRWNLEGPPDGSQGIGSIPAEIACGCARG